MALESLQTNRRKCNGQKPICVNCLKYDRTCVYDSDIRESRVKGLQEENQKLQDELAAAKLLMRQTAGGSAQLRRAVSDLLEEDRQPSEITHLLKHDESLNGEADGGRRSKTLSNVILHDVANDYLFPVEEIESFSADSSSLKQESSPDTDSCVAMESAAEPTYTANPYMISTPDYTSTEMLIDYNKPSARVRIKLPRGHPCARY